VVRAEDFYLPPPALPADAWTLLPPSERAVRWYEERAQRRLPRPSGILLGVRVYARIDASRWVAECPCRSAQVVSPDDPRMMCVECLAGWFAITFPDDVAAAETAVADLLPADRFWWHPDDDTAWNQPEDRPAAEPGVAQAAAAQLAKGKLL
jgi:hypothetical protein